MFRSRLFRFLLIVLLIGGIAAIVFNIWNRSEHHVPGNRPSEILNSQISRRSTDFEYSQLKGGRVLFLVKAGVSTTTRNDEHMLEQVHLVRLDEEGQETDTIDASSALYRINDKQLEFKDDVVINLSQGTRIFADRAEADLEREVVNIEEKFRFVQGSIEGSGEKLLYEINPRRLTINSGLKFEFGTGGQKGRSSALSGVYEMPAGIIRLRGDARVEMASHDLSASEIDLKLADQSRLERLSALGSASLQIGDERRFSGQRIEMVVPAEPGTPGSLVVFGDRISSDLPRVEAARYSESVEGGVNELLADRIDAPFFEDGAGSGIALSSLSGSGATSFRSEPADLTDGSAERFRADFAGSGAGISRLRLDGDAYLRRDVGVESVESGENDELWCRRLDLQFEDTGSPESCLAVGPVRLIHAGGAGTREVTAGGDAMIFYRDGLPQSIQATGGCRLVSENEVRRETLTAPTFQLLFSDGKPEEGLAEGGAEMKLTSAEENLTAFGEKLVTRFKGGEPFEAEFSGRFSLNRTDSGGALTVTGDTGLYDLADASLTIRGSHRPELTLESGGNTFRSRAEEFRLSRAKGEIVAERNVESALEGAGGISVITAQRMESSSTTGWIRYTGKPRLVQDENLVNAEEIRVNRAEGALEAAGHVDSVWVDRQKNEAKQFKVRSDRMRVMSTENRATYDGNVVLEAEELVLKAPRLEAYFAPAPAKGMDRIEASGGVDIREQGRHWQTEKAVYYRASDRVVAAK